jgi:glycosyl transferase family 25
LKCLVINLDRSADRLVHIGNTFGRLQIEFQRFPAIDGAQLSAAALDDINARNRWIRPMTRAEAGCLLSHQGCWEAIAASAEPFGVIFEDDVHISSGAHALLSSSNWIPPDADLIKLETRNRPVTIGRHSLRAPAGHRLVRLFSFHDGLGGYIISRHCARRLCEQIRERSAPVDQLVLNPEFGIFGRLDAFQLVPAICMPSQLARLADASVPDISSTIDLQGDLYLSDRELMRQSSAERGQDSSRREVERMLGRLQRLLRGQKRVRIAFRQ